MVGKKFIKLLKLIGSLVVIDIIAMMVVREDNPLSIAFGATVLVASVLALFYGIYVLLIKRPAAIPVKQIQTHEDYVEALSRYGRIRPLEPYIALGLKQLNRIGKKKETLFTVLDQRFDRTELSYQKFASVISEVEKLFYLNFRSILNRLHVFDESEFESVMKRKAPYSEEILRERAEVYNQHLMFIKASIDGNEEILLKLDKLLLEISRLDSLDPADIEQMPGIREIDALIKQTQYYKN